MSNKTKNILVFLATMFALFALFFELSNYPDISYFEAALYLAWVLCVPLSSYGAKRKIARLKRKYKLEGDYTIEKIEAYRIEKDYQENFVKKLNL